jgi:hypothetical protein
MAEIGCIGIHWVVGNMAGNNGFYNPMMSNVYFPLNPWTPFI